MRFLRILLPALMIAWSVSAQAAFNVVETPHSSYLLGSGGAGAGQSFIGDITNVALGDIIVFAVSYAGTETTITASDGGGTTWAQTDTYCDSNQCLVWVYTLASAVTGNPTYVVTLGAARSERRYQKFHLRPSAAASFGGHVAAHGSSASPSSGNLAVTGSDIYSLGAMALWNNNGGGASAHSINGSAASTVLSPTHYMHTWGASFTSSYTGAATATLSGSDAWIASQIYFRIGEVEEDDDTPDAFAFTDQTGVTRSTTITSAAVEITGINVAIECTATGGTIDVNADDDFQATREVENGDEIRARHTSSSSYSTSVNTTVDCNGVSDVFTSTTEAAPDIVATKLIFGSQPGNIVVGQTFGAFTVRAVDDDNSLDVDFVGDVTITLQTGDGTLAGTTTRSAVAGVATFDDISINTLNTGAVIRATADGLTAADSDPFNVTAGGDGAAGFPSTSRLGGMLQ